MNMIDVPKIDKAQEILKAREEITLPPKKYRISNEQSPSPYINIPSRALADIRILGNPSALQVLCVLCSYVSGQSGTAFPSQLLLAKRLSRSQQAISRQIVKLIDWGYIKKIINENALRQKGKKTATYRIIYDPGITDTQLIKTSTDPIVEQNKVDATLKKMEKKYVKLSPAQEKLAEDITQRYLKDETEFFPYETIHKAMVTYLSGKQTIDAWNKIGCGLLSPIEKGYLKAQDIQRKVVNKKELYNTRGCADTQHNDVVQNYNTITNNINIKDKVYELLRSYSHALDEVTKTRGQWRWTKREEAIAEEMIEAGVTIDAFMKEVGKVLNRCNQEQSRPPYTIAYFKSIWQTNKKKPQDTKQIIKGLVNKMNTRYT